MTRGTTRPLHLAALLHTGGWRHAVGQPAAPPAPADQEPPDAGGTAQAPPGPDAVAQTVARLARAGRQQDGTTCGAAALTMLAATGDPTLAAWLETGHLPTAAGTRRPPPELSGAPVEAMERLSHADAATRARAVHRVLQRRTARAGAPWPAALGTSPWGAAAVARFPGTAWGHHPLAGPEDVTTHLRRVGRWAERGIPVPLYGGGDLRSGLTAAVPRHVVLVIGHRRGILDVWEPSTGAVVSTPLDRLASGTGPLPALGGWSRVVWAVVPWRSGSPGARMGAVPVPRERWP